MNYELPAFTKEEGRSYILEKLQGAGANRAIFEDAALKVILNAADGTPRIINNLCNRYPLTVHNFPLHSQLS